MSSLQTCLSLLCYQYFMNKIDMSSNFENPDLLKVKVGVDCVHHIASHILHMSSEFLVRSVVQMVKSS